MKPTVTLRKRTAVDPADYVRRVNESYASDPRGYTFELVSIDGETKTGRKRYTMRTIIADPGFYDRARANR